MGSFDGLFVRMEFTSAICKRREARKPRRRERNLTKPKEQSILPVVGETDASSSGAQLARDNRLGSDEYRSGGVARSPAHLVSVG